MDARDFFAVAEKLRSSGIEAERRTSIGRSYYGLFHVLLAALSTRGVIFSETPDDHYKLISYLTKGKNRTAASVGNKLKDLRLQRNSADYRLKEVCSTGTSEFVYQKAKKALEEFDALSDSEITTLVETIQRLP